MICTNCSKKITPVVAIDIDGTLADYHGHFLWFAKMYLGKVRTYKQYLGEPSFKEWFCENFDVESRTWYDIKLAYRQGGMKRFQPIYDGAKRLVTYMRVAGSEVWLTTTRPYLRLDGIDPDTRFWLNQNDIIYDGLLYDEDKYTILAQNIDRERVVAVLDDLPEQYDAAERNFGPDVPILRQNNYNTLIDRPNKIDRLGEAAIVIRKRIAVWTREHGGSS